MGSSISTIAGVCYLEWGLVHIAAGVMTVVPALKNDVSAYLLNIYPGLDEAEAKAVKEAAFPRHTNRVLLQHGLNLGWAGVWSCALAYYCVTMKQLPRNFFLLGSVPYLLDWGYFIGIDMASIGNGPGEAQTFIISTGLACSAWLVNEQYGVSDSELAVTLGLPALLVGAGFLKQIGLIGTKKGAGKPTKGSGPTESTGSSKSK